MKKFLTTTVAIAASHAAIVLSAHAADLGGRGLRDAPPAYLPQSPPDYWTGFYVGAHLGGAFSSDDNFSGLGTGSNGNGRFLGGLQAGADWRFANTWVVGVEGQYSWLSGSVGAVFPGGFAYTNNQRGLGALTGRVGYTWGPGLAYVKGGYAFSDNNESLTLGGVPVGFVTSGDHANGYTVGVGVEYLFAPHWSAKAEYQYYNFGSATFVAPPPVAAFGSFTTNDHVVTVGVNYRINWSGPFVSHY